MAQEQSGKVCSQDRGHLLTGHAVGRRRTGRFRGMRDHHHLRCGHRAAAAVDLVLALGAVCALAVLREWDAEAQQVQAKGHKPLGTSDGHARGGKANHYRCSEVHCPA